MCYLLPWVSWMNILNGLKIWLEFFRVRFTRAIFRATERYYNELDIKNYLETSRLIKWFLFYDKRQDYTVTVIRSSPTMTDYELSSSLSSLLDRSSFKRLSHTYLWFSTIFLKKKNTIQEDMLNTCTYL